MQFFKKVWIVLNEPISFRRIYYSFLDALTGIKKNQRPKRLYTNYARVKKQEFEHIKSSTNALKLPEANIKEECFKIRYLCSRDFKFGFDLPPVQSVPQIFTALKWYIVKFDLRAVFRKYPLGFMSKLNFIKNDEIALPKNVIKSFSKRDLHLDESVQVTEELIEMMPYTRKLSRQKLMGIPIEKKPVPKLNFLEEELEYFKQVLAKQNKTRERNVEIINIYDRFNLKMFAGVKQDPKSKMLLCTPGNDAGKINKDELYYLVIGQRKDNKVALKAVANLAQ